MLALLISSTAGKSRNLRVPRSYRHQTFNSDHDQRLTAIHRGQSGADAARSELSQIEARPATYLNGGRGEQVGEVEVERGVEVEQHVPHLLQQHAVLVTRPAQLLQQRLLGPADSTTDR